MDTNSLMSALKSNNFVSFKQGKNKIIVIRYSVECSGCLL